MIFVQVLASFVLPLLTAAIPAQYQRAENLLRRAVVNPQDDAFYAAPANLSAYAPGDIIRSRPVPNSLAILGTFPVNIKQADQLLYRTTDAKGNPQAVVTTVIVPTNADYTKHLSYQIEYDSAWTGCNPSVALQQGLDPDSFAAQYSILLYIAALNQGWVVSTSDYEGSQAAFTAGKQAGQATLDSIRAVLKSESITGVVPTATNCMWGYSGGALASEWAAELRSSYAPELNIAGAALGGLTPNVAEVVHTINQGPFAGLAPAGIRGLAAAYPELADYLNEHLVPWKRGYFDRVLSQCTISDALDFVFQDIFSYFDNGEAILTDDIPLAVIKDGGTMGLHGTPDIPLHVYKAINDEVSLVADTDALVAQYCAAGVSISYEREELAEHLFEAVTGSAGALRFLIDRFNGVAPQQGCTTTSTATEVLDPANAPLYGQTIFDDLAALLCKL